MASKRGEAPQEAAVEVSVQLHRQAVVIMDTILTAVENERALVCLAL